MNKREPEIEYKQKSTDFDTYTIYLYSLFCKYLGVAKEQADETRMNPNVENMLQTFRKIYGRSVS